MAKKDLTSLTLNVPKLKTLNSCIHLSSKLIVGRVPGTASCRLGCGVSENEGAPLKDTWDMGFIRVRV